jgi:hypothetical protein
LSSGRGGDLSEVKFLGSKERLNMIASPATLNLESKAHSETALAIEARGMNETAQDAVDETLYLIGRPTLKQFCRFVRSHAVNPPSEGTLSDEWQAANHVVRALQVEEPGIADSPSIRKLTPFYEPLLIEFLKDPLVRNGFNTVPTEVAIVELDRLVVYQHHIDLTFVRQLQSELGPAPTEGQIFRTCLPYDHPQPPVKWCRAHRDSFVFMSPSNDLRFLGTMPLESNHIKDYAPPGNLVSVVGLAIGFGSNFLNAVYSENRLILNNGSHRAYALREMGVTHVPCIVQHVSSRDELEMVAASDVLEDPDNYLKQPRPSMLRDYFDPRLRKVMPVHRRLRQVTVKFEIDEAYVPAF